MALIETADDTAALLELRHRGGGCRREVVGVRVRRRLNVKIESAGSHFPAAKIQFPH